MVEVASSYTSRTAYTREKKEREKQEAELRMQAEQDEINKAVAIKFNTTKNNCQELPAQ